MSKFVRLTIGSALVAVPLNFAHAPDAAAQELESFGVISGQSLTNTGPTIINGNIAVWPGVSYTGRNTVVQTGELFLGDAVARRAQDDLTTVYNVLSGRLTSVGGDLTGQDLGGMVLNAGVYNFDTSASLASNQTLTLDGRGNPNAIFIFNVGSTLTAGPNSNMLLLNGAHGGNVFFRIGSSATLDTSTALQGQLVALTSITMNTSATLDCGAAYARNGSVTLDTNVIEICRLTAGVFDPPSEPEPTEPEPTDPEPTEPGPTEPGPSEPGPSEPEPSGPELSERERAVARALQDFIASGGTLPLGFRILAATLTPEELAESLAQLSGEVVTGAAPMVMQSMDAFLDTVVRSGRGPRVENIIAPRVHGAPIGLVQEDNVYTGKSGSGTPTPSAQPLTFSTTLAASETGSWNMWLSGYGSRNVTRANTRRGHEERVTVSKGLATGINFAPTNGTNFGIAASWNTADFTLSNNFGSGSSNSAFIAVRGRTESDRGYIEGALAYGRSRISTDRTLTIAGIDQFVGKTTAESIAARIEAGLHMGMFTPFVGLRAQSVRVKGFSETLEMGSSSYALQYEAHTATSIRSELGVEMQWPANTNGHQNATFGVRAAWARELASHRSNSATFMNATGVSFPVTGATRDRNSLVLAASATLADSNGLSVVAAIRTEHSRNSTDYSGSVTVGYRW